MSWVRNAVAVAAAVLAFVLTTTPVSNSETSNKSVSHLNNSILFGKMPKGSSLTEIDLTKEQTKLVAEKTDSLVPPKAIEAKKDTTETKQTAVSYCIVLASYVSKKNANAFVERLHKEGYAEAEVFIRNNVTRVVYGRFKTENAAYNKLRSIRGDKDFDEAWILKIKRGSGQEDHV